MRLQRWLCVFAVPVLMVGALATRAEAAVIISRAELNGSKLRVEGTGRRSKGSRNRRRSDKRSHSRSGPATKPCQRLGIDQPLGEASASGRRLPPAGIEATLASVIDGPDMRSRYEQALAEVEEMKRALREHAQHVAAREKELEQLRLDVAGRQGRRGGGGPAAAERSADLARAIADAEKREREAVQELALAKAEREKLDEREQNIRKVERSIPPWCAER